MTVIDAPPCDDILEADRQLLLFKFVSQKHACVGMYIPLLEFRLPYMEEFPLLGVHALGSRLRS